MEDGSRDPQLVSGLSVSFNLGVTQDWSHETFIGDISTYNGELGVGFDIKYIVGAGVCIGDSRVSANIGVGVGLKIDVINTEVVSSISLTYEESKLFEGPYRQWHVEYAKYDKANGKWTGSVSYGKGNVKVSCDNKVVDGINVPSEIWMSDEYKTSAFKAEGWSNQ